MAFAFMGSASAPAPECHLSRMGHQSGLARPRGMRRVADSADARLPGALHGLPRRILQVMTSEASLQTIDAFPDPITGAHAPPLCSSMHTPSCLSTPCLLLIEDDAGTASDASDACRRRGIRRT